MAGNDEGQYLIHNVCCCLIYSTGSFYFDDSFWAKFMVLCGMHQVYG